MLDKNVCPSLPVRSHSVHAIRPLPGYHAIHTGSSSLLSSTSIAVPPDAALLNGLVETSLDNLNIPITSWG